LNRQNTLLVKEHGMCDLIMNLKSKAQYIRNILILVFQCS